RGADRWTPGEQLRNISHPNRIVVTDPVFQPIGKQGALLASLQRNASSNPPAKAQENHRERE
ncbi:MAG: hypothetical protein O7I42_08560, partial [Alphaproteobacteria bacterium]|nr:hypothetical protein [Alphaproteobacteria bacterium]